MLENKEQFIVILTGRSYLYQLLQSLFGNEPNREILEQFTADITENAVSLFFEESASETADFLALIAKVRDELNVGGEDFVDSLRSEYTRLFIGPASLPSPPWESVHKSGEKLLLQKETLEVRMVYKRNGFVSKTYPHEPDDHIGIELDFMYRLSEQTSASLEADNLEGARSLISEQQAFLVEHLLAWVGKFAVGLKKYKTDSFYAITAVFLDAFLNADKDTLTELSQVIGGQLA
ncbi:MAG: molecular chaperone TorD family protein [Coriobacteriales bacterium]|jgi:TorA maturation chaperone TorD|nr:molecular chaperone TorD family protein [Coriobacteriales bacterium]